MSTAEIVSLMLSFGALAVTVIIWLASSKRESKYRTLLASTENRYRELLIEREDAAKRLELMRWTSEIHLQVLDAIIRVPRAMSELGACGGHTEEKWRKALGRISDEMRKVREEQQKRDLNNPLTAPELIELRYQVDTATIRLATLENDIAKNKGTG